MAAGCYSLGNIGNDTPAPMYTAVLHDSMATQTRQFKTEAGQLEVRIIDADEKRVQIDPPDHERIDAAVVDNVAQVEAPLPEWARVALARVGLEGYEVVA